MTAEKSLLLKGRLGERAVEIPGIGTVRVRGLSRLEVMEMQDLGRVEAEVYLFSRGLIDPALTEDETREALAVAPGGELQPIADAVFELSGLTTDAARSATRSFPGGPDEEPGVSSSAHPGHVGPPATD